MKIPHGSEVALPGLLMVEMINDVQVDVQDVGIVMTTNHIGRMMRNLMSPDVRRDPKVADPNVSSSQGDPSGETNDENSTLK